GQGDRDHWILPDSIERKIGPVPASRQPLSAPYWFHPRHLPGPSWRPGPAKEIRMFIRGRNPRVPRLLVAAALLGGVGGPALAQRAPVLRHLADVKQLPGTLVAQAKSAAPETAMKLTGY